MTNREKNLINFAQNTKCIEIVKWLAAKYLFVFFCCHISEIANIIYVLIINNKSLSHTLISWIVAQKIVWKKLQQIGEINHKTQIG